MRHLGQLTLRLIDGCGEWRSVREGGCDRDQRSDAPEQAAEQHHLPQTHVAREAGKTLAQWCEAVPDVVQRRPLRSGRTHALLQHTHGLQRHDGLVNARLGWRVHSLQEATGLHAAAEQREQEFHEGTAKNLGRRHDLEFLPETRVRDEMKTETLADAPCATSPLHELRPRNEVFRQRGSVRGLVVALTLHLASIDHEHHVWNRDTRLCDVRADHDLATTMGRSFKGFGLIIARQHAVEGQHQTLRAAEEVVVGESVLELGNLRQTREENENGSLVARDRHEGRVVFDALQNKLNQIVIDARMIHQSQGSCSLSTIDQSLVTRVRARVRLPAEILFLGVVPPSALPPPVLAATIASVSCDTNDILHPVSFNGERTTRDGHHGHRKTEVTTQLLTINRRRHQDDAKSWASLAYLLQQK
mmetsp:Transcript_29954/g.79871  ORF Transcript_29954/g.79871 Transcript_29954/m.79871 type:complete len:417 (-) Transcript_29954:2755-4005(-)